MTNRAFRRILDEGDSSDSERPTSLDQTKLYETKMAEIMLEIEQQLISLSSLPDPPAGERVDRDVVQAQLNQYINVELKETIDTLFHS